MPISPLSTVVLARHGETEWNRVGRRQGQLDSPLTDRGWEQARAAADRVATLPIDAVFASPLRRAALTAARCADRLRLPVTTLEDLAEVHHGRMAGLTSEEIDQRFPGECARRAGNKYHWRFPDGESYADADRRAAAALTRIASAGWRHPLIVSHEMIARLLLRRLTGTDPASALRWSQPHEVIYRVDVATRAVERL